MGHGLWRSAGTEANPEAEYTPLPWDRSPFKQPLAATRTCTAARSNIRNRRTSSCRTTCRASWPQNATAIATSAAREGNRNSSAAPMRPREANRSSVFLQLKKERGERRTPLVFILIFGNRVTTPRSDAMYVVREFGMANLKGKCIAERARAIVTFVDFTLRFFFVYSGTRPTVCRKPNICGDQLQQIATRRTEA